MRKVSASRPITSALKVGVGAALIAVVLVAAGGPAGAGTYERFRFDDDVSSVGDFCGLPARFEFHDSGVVVARETGPNRLVRYTASHHGGSTTTDLATGATLFSVTWNYLSQDVRLTDNGDGTYTILSQVPGPERWYGPDGEILYTSGGTFRFEVTLDAAGTPSDPSDDAFISEVLVSEHGGRDQEAPDVCESVLALTS